MAGALGVRRTHIGVLCVDTSDEIGEAILLLVFVWDEKRVDVEISMVYLKASLVGDPVAIPEGRSTREMIAGHIMDFTEVATRENKLEELGGRFSCRYRRRHYAVTLCSDLRRKVVSARQKMNEDRSNLACKQE